MWVMLFHGFIFFYYFVLNTIPVWKIKEDQQVSENFFVGKLKYENFYELIGK